MLLINYSREIFQPLASGIRYAEIGVYKGLYAKGVKRYAPKEMYLIDPWKAPPPEALIPLDFVGDAAGSLENAISGYYVGGIEKALEEAYPQVLAEFGDMLNCKIIRKSSADAYQDFEDGSLDVIYVDGNHRYDYVLADLERWSSKASAGGYLILNDCYVSPIGKKQHMSVLEAVSTFTKLTDWVVAAGVNQDYTDLVLTRRQNAQNAKNVLLALLMTNDVKFVELPSTLIHCMCHRTATWVQDGQTFSREYMSFGD